MGPLSTGGWIGLGLLLLGAGIQTVNPTFFDKKFDQTAFKLTASILLLLASVGL